MSVRCSLVPFSLKSKTGNVVIRLSILPVFAFQVSRAQFWSLRQRKCKTQAGPLRDSTYPTTHIFGEFASMAQPFRFRFFGLKSSQIFNSWTEGFFDVSGPEMPVDTNCEIDSDACRPSPRWAAISVPLELKQSCES